jgi:hypothetical protein
MNEEIGPRWGRESFNYQHYELDLSPVEAPPGDRSAVA